MLKDVYTALETLLNADSTLTAYCKDIFPGFNEEIANLTPNYEIILEPGTEKEEEVGNGIMAAEYEILIYALFENTNYAEEIKGAGTFKGLLDFIADIKSAIRNTWQLDLRYTRTNEQAAIGSFSSPFDVVVIGTPYAVSAMRNVTQASDLTYVSHDGNVIHYTGVTPDVDDVIQVTYNYNAIDSYKFGEVVYDTEEYPLRRVALPVKFREVEILS